MPSLTKAQLDEFTRQYVKLREAGRSGEIVIAPDRAWTLVVKPRTSTLTPITFEVRHQETLDTPG